MRGHGTRNTDSFLVRNRHSPARPGVTPGAGTAAERICQLNQPIVEDRTRLCGARSQNPPENKAFRRDSALPEPYSAATRDSLLSAELYMKSEIRGTISERKREPLNTP